MSDRILKESEVIKALCDAVDAKAHGGEWLYTDEFCEAISNVPSAEEEEFEWCHDCKEYDQDAHCCHRYSKRIRQAVEEIKASRPQGEWIKNYYGTVICSECKCPRRDNRVGHTRFCNACGARMKGADDE